MTLRNTAYFCIATAGIITALIFGKDLILPFILGGLFWFMMRGLIALINRIPKVKERVPSWLKSLFAAGIFIGVMSIIASILSSNIQHLSQSYSQYQSNVALILQKLNEAFNVNLSEMAKTKVGDFNFGNLLGVLLNSFSDLLGYAFMILLYALFILIEEGNFKEKLKRLFPDQDQFAMVSNTMTQIENSVSDYFRLKAFVSFITGILSYLVLLIIGVDSPAFWGFLIFILNFIPTIGSLIGTIFPAVYSLLQFGEFTPFLLVLLIVGVIQIIVGNIIEPRLMGSSMNLSPIVTILALTFWGMLWGIIGMILSIPIMVVLVIIFSQFESTKKVAILLSEKGEIES